MELSRRLSLIIQNIDECDTLVDVGTDHGYIPIKCIKDGLCKKAIASDINKDPLDKAKLNSVFEGVDEEVEFRLGSGLSTVEVSECNGIVIAGMGGNLIRDILEEDKEVVKEADYLILLPAQNPEVLREYLYTNNYEIIKEDLCLDDGIYYELFKVRSKDGETTELDSIYYEVSPTLLRERHELLKGFIESKIEKYEKIKGLITDDSESAKLRLEELNTKIDVLNNLLNYCS